jgi:two-component system, chemotaxis family, CheB/CheR fusion protein
MKKKDGNPKQSSKDENKNLSAQSPIHSHNIPIVGIGASAGGYEALGQLLKALPSDTGLSFMCVQHLSREHKSILPELLSRETSMEVLHAKDGMKISPDHVFIIPPDTVMTLVDDAIRLESREPADGAFLPIDSLFRSLADVQKNKAIGVILSGTGSDGTLGIRAIKAEGGLTFAQEMASAKFDGMPRSAISTGDIDFVLSPERIAEELARIGRHPYLIYSEFEKTEEPDAANDDNIHKIFAILRSITEVDFTLYKLNTIKRRIVRRMVLHELNDTSQYVEFLENNPAEVNNLYQDMLINVTNFFRDPTSYDALEKSVFPHIMSHKDGDRTIRIWVPGCSTGEEAYSIGIVLLEFLGEKSHKIDIQIFATDINETAVDKARAGIYLDNIKQEVSPERLQRFFVRTNAGYQINKTVRNLCVFAKHDLSKDPPYSKLDFISCRNLLIYLNSDLQKKVIPSFHYALNPGGILLLGNSESIGGFGDLFQLIDKKHKIYEKKRSYHNANLNFSMSKNIGRTDIGKRPESPGSQLDIEKEAERIIAAKYTPLSILINEDMGIVQFRGDIGVYLQPVTGQASLNLFKIAREGLIFDLRTAIHKAKKENKTVIQNNVRFSFDGGRKKVNIEVTPIKGSKEIASLYFLIVFHDFTALQAKNKEGKAHYGAAAGDSTVKKLEDELKATKEYLESIIEQKEAFNEELHSAIEELQSSNEELQSTNEEMETAKEELQSTNEELSTVNDELAARNEELTSVNNDLTNLLGSINIPILMLDSNLRIRRFTLAAEKILNIIAADVGRPINDLRLNADIPNFTEIIRDVIRTLETREVHVQVSGGNWYIMKIRPYRTLDDKIDGVVIAFLDIQLMKEDMQSTEDALDFAQTIIDALNDPLLILYSDFKIKSANNVFYSEFGLTKNQVDGKYIYEISEGLYKNDEFRDYLENLSGPEHNKSSRFFLETEIKGKGKVRLDVNARDLIKPDYIIITMEIKPIT